MSDKPAIVPGSPEHDAAMIALADQNSTIMISDSAGNRAALPKQGATPAAGAEVKPEGEQLILGKFKTQADLEAAYQELQRKQSQPKPAEAKPAAKPAAAPQVDHKAAVDAAITKVIAAQAKLASATDDAAKTAAQAELAAANAEAVAANTAALAPPVQEETPAESGLASAMALAAKSYTETGEISEEAFVALEAQGLTREYTQQYATGLKATAELVEVKTYAEVGGKEQYTVIKAWADANLTQAQKDAFDKAMQGDLATHLGSVRNMKALYEAANGRAPTVRIEAEGGGSGPPVPMFRSEAEVTKAMSDPRYATDPAYRKDVEAKMLASMNAGVNVLR